MFKNIYKGIIVLIIISAIIMILDTFEVIILTSEFDNIITPIAAVILLNGFLLSRNANVVANKKNDLMPWITTFILLVYLLIQILAIVIDDFSISSDVSDIINKVLLLITCIILVFEIPQVNSLHGALQKITVVLAIITYAFYYGRASLTDSAIKTINPQKLEQIAKTAETLAKGYQLSLYLTISGFLINPMLRAIYYSKDDYANTNEIDEILNNTYNYPNNNNYNNYNNNNNYPNNNNYNNYNNYNNNNNYNGTINQQFQQPMPPYQQTMEQQLIISEDPLPPPIINEMPPVVEEISQEKVLNQQFHPEELPEAIIPSIDIIPASEPVVNTIDNPNEQSETIQAPVSEQPTEVNANQLETVSQPIPNPIEENPLNIVKPTE